jgi:16S rRNA (guanine527-N7)-methyltransferase
MESSRPSEQEWAQLAEIGVSRETTERLATYADLLLKWTRRINLIGPKTEPAIWQRHILDSLQLMPHLDPAQRIADIGSGAGLPGLVLAIAGCQDMHLVESDQRKAAFLREANRVCGAGATIHAARAEACADIRAEIVVSRACAPITKLLDLASVIAAEKSQCLFLKGLHVDDELTEAHKKWFIDARRIESLTDPAGIILHIGAFRHVTDRN